MSIDKSKRKSTNKEISVNIITGKGLDGENLEVISSGSFLSGKINEKSETVTIKAYNGNKKEYTQSQESETR